MRRHLTPSLLVVSLCATAAASIGACSSDGGSGSGGSSSNASSTASGDTSSSSGGATSTAASTTGGSSSSSGSSGAGGAAPQQIMVMFDPHVGDKPFKCTDTYPGLGTTAADVTISDFRLYVHDVTLHQKGGADVPVDLVQDGLWQYKNVALLDFEDKKGACSNGTAETNVMITGTVPAGAYDGLSFKVGVPFALNHADVASAPSPLNLSGMFWSWNDGYKFVRIDAAPAGFGPFLVHVGSTDCQGDFADGGVSACNRPNIAQINLAGFDLDHNMVVVDYAALVAGSDMSKNGGNAPGCMSESADPECVEIFSRIGIDIADGSLHPDQQKLFRLE